LGWWLRWQAWEQAQRSHDAVRHQQQVTAREGSWAEELTPQEIADIAWSTDERD
jgi:hypothetical protein